MVPESAGQVYPCSAVEIKAMANNTFRSSGWKRTCSEGPCRDCLRRCLVACWGFEFAPTPWCDSLGSSSFGSNSFSRGGFASSLRHDWWGGLLWSIVNVGFQLVCMRFCSLLSAVITWSCTSRSSSSGFSNNLKIIRSVKTMIVKLGVVDASLVSSFALTAHPRRNVDMYTVSNSFFIQECALAIHCMRLRRRR